MVSSNGKQYVGSTTQTLSKRKSVHKKDYKRWLDGRKRCGSIYKLFEGGGEVDIYLLEDYPCERKEQLHARERYWIENIDGSCVNNRIPTRSVKEHLETFRNVILERKKTWSQEKIKCECGSEVCRSSLSAHRRSKKHQKTMT